MVQSKNQGLIFLVLGDIHGQLNKAARLLRQVESDSGVQIDFVLQVGDFGAHRHQQDLFTMYAPFREKRMGDFFHYLNRDKPWFTAWGTSSPVMKPGHCLYLMETG
jgi:hypothetical protein